MLTLVYHHAIKAILRINKGGKTFIVLRKFSSLQLMEMDLWQTKNKMDLKYKKQDKLFLFKHLPNISLKSERIS
jgi:hypothetical protein